MARRVGLALSGGGFRATVYHLGVLRFLRDADILPRVSHITSVSGGSITAAHLVLNWERYTGSQQDFNEAANELLDFIRMDPRNRIVRRIPLGMAGNALRTLFRLGRLRRWTRPGLLESHYEKYLYGNKCLYELPSDPKLHLLATDLNQGALCSFTRSGLLLQHRNPEGGSRFELVPSALATVAMAVTASSAFPGFFPPLQLTAEDVGADEGRFPPHIFTDGGVYDNLGIRMFHHIRETWMIQDTPLRADDFIDLNAAQTALVSAEEKDDQTPLGRLAHLVKRRAAERTNSPGRLPAEDLPGSLWNVIVHDQLYCDPAFAKLEMDDEQASHLRYLAQHGRELDRGDHLWLNRYLADIGFASATGRPLFSSTQVEFDAVIVSDAGKEFTTSRRTKGGGLVGTAMRSSDILMDRVWKLEIEHFTSASGCVFAPISATVQLAEDSHALHPEIQHQVCNMRTDLDRFSDLEISGLIRHGYGVMRNVCRSHPELFPEELPSGPPWDPTVLAMSTPSSSARSTSEITHQARDLQESKQRNLFGHLLSPRDWPTYVYIPLIAILVVVLPYFTFNAYKRATRSTMIVNAITYSNPDFQLVLEIARQNPVPGEWVALPAEEVAELTPVELKGFRLITDTRVFDLRAWQPDSTDREHQFITYRRMQVRRVTPAPDVNGNVSALGNKFRIQQFGLTRDVSVKRNTNSLQAIFRRTPHVGPSGQAGFLNELEFDLSSVPEGRDFEIGFEVTEPGLQGRKGADERLSFPILAPTDVATMWVFLPEGRPFRSYQLIGYDPEIPTVVDSIEPTYDFELADGTLLGWMLVAPQSNYTYECRWTYRE